MRILYLADIRFPLERANGIQSMETCYALAARGHVVTMGVRPDTQSPARDPFAFYGLPRIAGVRVETAVVTGPAVARRAGYLAFALTRATGRGRQDVIFTRDLGLAALLLRIPAPLRAPVVYEAHGIAAETAAALPTMVSGAPPASPAKIRRLSSRESRVWHAADGYVTITAGLKTELERRFGSRPRIAVVPDGARLATEDAEQKTAAEFPAHQFTVGYAGHLYPWKGVDLVVEAIAAMDDTRGLIIGGHEKEPDLARVKALATTLGCSSRVTFTGLLPPGDVAARLRQADVLALPNPASAIAREFTSPLKLFEYMASGRPIVASDLPSFREVLTDGRNAVLVEAGRAEALAAGILRIKDDPSFGRQLAAQALIDVRAYTWAGRATALETLFADVIGGSAAASGGADRDERPAPQRPR